MSEMYSTRTAFTLVEMVVVVLILGILAAVAAPRAFHAADQASDNAARKSLRTIRDAIDFYKLETGSLPGENGEQATFKKQLAPYLRNSSFPICPVGVAKNGEIKMVKSFAIVGDVAPTQGWAYSILTGEFIINCATPTVSDPTINYDEL